MTFTAYWLEKPNSNFESTKTNYLLHVYEQKINCKKNTDAETALMKIKDFFYILLKNDYLSTQFIYCFNTETVDQLKSKTYQEKKHLYLMLKTYCDKDSSLSNELVECINNIYKEYFIVKLAHIECEDGFDF